MAILDDGSVEFMCCIADGSSAIKSGGRFDDPTKVTLELSGMQATPETIGALMLLREQLLHVTIKVMQHGEE